MRIATVLTPLNQTNLRLAAQVGVTDVVARYPGPRAADMAELVRRVHAHGLRVSVIEGYVPHQHIVHGTADKDRQILIFKQVIDHMAEHGIEILCYNFMPNDDWARTATQVPDRGGALVTAFDIDAVVATPGLAPIVAARLWENLTRFVAEVIPHAERRGVTMAVHPDDPPLSPLLGQDRILVDVAGLDRVLALADTRAHALCFCQGTFAQMGVSVAQAIRHFGDRIGYVHFRDVIGTVPRFRETFHDAGKTDMAAAIAAYREVGFKGLMRPDHVPVMEGDRATDAVQVRMPSDDEINVNTFNSPQSRPGPGYTMTGRLFAIGYIRGLLDASSK